MVVLIPLMLLTVLGIIIFLPNITEKKKYSTPNTEEHKFSDMTLYRLKNDLLRFHDVALYLGNSDKPININLIDDLIEKKIPFFLIVDKRSSYLFYEFEYNKLKYEYKYCGKITHYDIADVVEYDYLPSELEHINYIRLMESI